MDHRIATGIADNEAAHRAAFVVDLMANPISKDMRQYLAHALRTRAARSRHKQAKEDVLLRLSQRIQQAQKSHKSPWLSPDSRDVTN